MSPPTAQLVSSRSHIRTIYLGGPSRQLHFERAMREARRLSNLQLSRLRTEAEKSGRRFENARDQLPSEVAQHSLLRDVLRAHEQLLQSLPPP